MQVENKQEIIILDPGLREFGGHHPAIIEGLLHSSAIAQENLNITVYSNIDISEALRLQLSKGNTEVIPYFNTDFYCYFYSQEKLPSFNQYIRILAKEYFQVMSRFEHKSITFLYHTLNWEHAAALSLAIALYQQGNGLSHRHLVCLMYNPCWFDNNKNLQQDRYFKFSFGFKTLSKHPNVSLFAAEYELTYYYQVMLGCHIGWHPCSLLSSRHMKEVIEHKKTDQNILLYLGDAKDNKGFLALPKLVESLISAIQEPGCFFVMQYTITNNRRDLVVVDSALQKLQERDSRIVIYRHFLSDEEMHQLWLSTQYVIFNYDENAYQSQSSGVLWLAVAYQTTMYFMTNTWLNREAKRLHSHFYESSNIEQTKGQLLGTIRKVKKNVIKIPNERYDATNEYSKRIFSDFGIWLVKELRLEGIRV